MHANLTADSGSAYELCPDRITGRASLAELQRLCPERTFRFVAINVPYTKTILHREKVMSLMHPHNTEMDLSIAYALYFAARGEGELPNQLDGETAPYTTSARVLLSGLGADELFGGYTRHATAFKRAGYPGLIDELELDVARLGKRNLGRDDRVISHWGREARFPFLDESLLSWALDAPVNDKCGFGEQDADVNEDGSQSLEPGKKVLRCLAWKLGMQNVEKEKKRAVCIHLGHRRDTINKVIADSVWRANSQDGERENEGDPPAIVATPLVLLLKKVCRGLVLFFFSGTMMMWPGCDFVAPVPSDTFETPP